MNTMIKWRVICNDGQGTTMKAVFLSQYDDVAEAIKDFNRRNPGWIVTSFYTTLKKQAQAQP
jgi:hypothetical protein